MVNPQANKRRGITLGRCRAGADWGRGLSEELLNLISMKLVLVTDYLRFGMVCKSWHSATLGSLNRKHRIESRLFSSHHTRLPLLLFPPPPQTSDNCEPEEGNHEEAVGRKQQGNDFLWVRTLYSFIEKKVVCDKFEFPAPNARNRCFGSSHGWLITASRTPGKEDSAVSLTLVNPFYIGGGRRWCKGMITLPPLEPYPGEPSNMSPAMSISKAVLSADPANAPDDYVVIVIINILDQMAYIRSGDKNWTRPRFKEPTFRYNSCHDVIYRKKRIYVASALGGLAVCDISANKPCIRIVASPHRDRLNPYSRAVNHYVVESPHPESSIFLVYRFASISIGYGDDIPHYSIGTTEFRVYRLVEIGSLKSWVKMKSIGNRVFFLGDNHSTCVLASDFPDGCLKPNSIYFTDDRLAACACSTEETVPPHVPCDMGIYSLEDDTIQPYYFGPVSSLLAIPPPIWFLPSIPGNWP